MIVDRWLAGSLVAGLLAGWGISEVGKPTFAVPAAGPRTYSTSRSAGDELWRAGSRPWLQTPSRNDGEGPRVKRRDEPRKEPRRGRAQARAAVDDSRELEDVVASEPTQASPSRSSPAWSIQRPSSASGDRKGDSGGDGNTDGSGASDADGADGGGADVAEDDSGGVVGGGGGGGGH
jgi:hypothetical protein